MHEDVRTHQLSRAELYDRVWTTPMRTLAAAFGVSDVGLSKLCRRHLIPTPWAGYWTEKQFGKDKPRPALPSTPNTDLESVIIHPTPRVARCEPASKIRIPVLQKLVRPHPLVKQTVQALRAATPGSDGRVTPRGSRLCFAPLAAEIAVALRVRNAILDGEVVCLDGDGSPLFNALLYRRSEPCFVTFDCLWLDGEDLRRLPLIDRKRVLRRIIPHRPACV